MTPVELAAQLYDDVADFRRHLEAHLLHGYVHSTPAGFVMARPVCSTAPAEIIDPWHVFPREECDAWWIWLAAGDLGSLMHLFPYELPLIGWQRYWKGRPSVKFYSMEAVKKRLSF
ncbi:hypothetical protein SAMN02745166_01498 [Prosthecobacter debontii]|uniref:Uncharacterized protein n=1 Tax=Prosthecobacter debontii TaxID=48467 RepID=A0A1T4XID9_9BACT|nr:hypothetical protein [Prosthecobacter debontii]SKA88865.1 hypothetical protein SAMN02745166_01498 [Prosthecobacter debontii]